MEPFNKQVFLERLDCAESEDEVLGILSSSLSSLYGEVYVSLWIHDAKKRVLLLVGERGHKQIGVGPKHNRVRLGETSAVSRAAETGRPVQLDMHKAEDKAICKAQDFIEAEQIKSVLAVPCTLMGDPLGVVVIAKRTEYAWNDIETRTLKFLGTRALSRVSKTSKEAELDVLVELLTSVFLSDICGYLNSAASILAKRTRSDACLLWTSKKEAHQTGLQGSYPPTEASAEPCALDKSLLGEVARIGRPIRLFHIKDSSELSEYGIDVAAVGLLDNVLGFSEFAHAIGLPLSLQRFNNQAEPFGALLLVRDPSKTGFYPSDEEPLAAAATSIATSVDRIRMVDRITQLLHITNTLYSAKDVSGLVDTVVLAAVELFGADIALVATLDEKSGRLNVRAQLGLPSEIQDHLDLRLGMGIVGRAVKEGKVFVVPMAELEPNFVQLVPDKLMRSEMAVPIMREDRGIGILNIESCRPGAYSDDQRDIIEAAQVFANQVAIAMDQTALREERENLQARLSYASSRMVAAVLSLGLGHEVKNSLNALSGNLRYLKGLIDDLKSSDHKQVREITDTLERAQTEISRLGDLAKKVMSMSQGESRKTHTYLNKIVESFGALLIKTVKDSGLKLVVTLDPSLSEPKEAKGKGNPIYADEAQIGQVLVNLVTNSMDAYRATGKEGKIEVSTFKTEVGNRNYAAFRVVDYGIGMDDSTRRQIFTEFFTTKEQGLGLGLRIAKEIVNNHEGDIEFASTPWKGTTFVVTLPIMERGE